MPQGSLLQIYQPSLHPHFPCHHNSLFDVIQIKYREMFLSLSALWKQLKTVTVPWNSCSLVRSPSKCFASEPIEWGWLNFSSVSLSHKPFLNFEGKRFQIIVFGYDEAKRTLLFSLQSWVVDRKFPETKSQREPSQWGERRNNGVQTSVTLQRSPSSNNGAAELRSCLAGGFGEAGTIIPFVPSSKVASCRLSSLPLPFYKSWLAISLQDTFHHNLKYRCEPFPWCLDSLCPPVMLHWRGLFTITLISQCWCAF